ncbi:hypothetical protein GCM10017687_31310 [Streptomyces echinatus]|uniref:hypothetical protein n=1 Tax=Streptomyces echinatus TaxID=67293 RepID=UPI0031E94128
MSAIPWWVHTVNSTAMPTPASGHDRGGQELAVVAAPEAVAQEALGLQERRGEGESEQQGRAPGGPQQRAERGLPVHRGSLLALQGRQAGLYPGALLRQDAGGVAEVGLAQHASVGLELGLLDLDGVDGDQPGDRLQGLAARRSADVVVGGGGRETLRGDGDLLLEVAGRGRRAGVPLGLAERVQRGVEGQDGRGAGGAQRVHVVVHALVGHEQGQREQGRQGQQQAVADGEVAGGRTAALPRTRAGAGEPVEQHAEATGPPAGGTPVRGTASRARHGGRTVARELSGVRAAGGVHADGSLSGRPQSPPQ